MFSSTGTRSESGIGRLWLKTLSPALAASASGVAVKLDAERMLGGQRLDNGDIGDGGRRRIDLTIVDREGIAIAREQRASPWRRVRGGKRLFETVDPAAHDRLDRAIENGAIDDAASRLRSAR